MPNWEVAKVSDINSSLKKYFRDIEKLLVCSKDEKKKLISDLHISIENYIANNSNVSIDDIITNFGTPEQISEYSLASEEHSHTVRSIKSKSKIIRIVLAAVTVIAIIIGAYLFIDLKIKESHANGRFVDTIQEYSTSEDLPPVILEEHS